MLVFYLYYAFGVALSFILFTIGSRNASQDQQGLIDYFTCEAFGIDSNDPCILNVDHTETLAFTSVAYFGHAMGPYATLIFIFPINKIREKWRNKN